MISDSNLERYSRQILVPGVELEGQAALGEAHVIVVGCGGLGVPAALYLGAAGIGTLTLIDDDRVELSNLPRQPLFRVSDIGRLKGEVLCEHLLANRPSATIRCFTQRLEPHNAPALLEGADVVVDATDNRSTRLLIDRVTHGTSTPWVMGAATRLSGQTIAFDAARAWGCYHCLVVDPESESIGNCADLGIVGSAVAGVALQQVTDVIKLLTGCGVVPWGQCRVFDDATNERYSLQLQKRSGCANCGYT
jgi:molybdopterin/thiamine biosynthesis adenylyltransferase